MIKGLNSDVYFNGKNYHVQTEDWGVESAYIMSRVFISGAVVKTVRVEYSEIGSDVRVAMESQHQQILDLIHSGQIQ